MLTSVFLSLLSVWLTQAQVQIVFRPPDVTFYLPNESSHTTNVIFRYTLAGAEHFSRAAQTSTGWETTLSLPAPLPPSGVLVHAEIHYKNGTTISTTRARFVPDSSEAANVVPGGRRIRVVIFRDDFNSFNRLDWNPEVSMFGGTNGEIQVYTNDAKNIFTRDGKLFLYPTLTVDDPRFDENYLKTGIMDLTQIFGLCTNSAFDGCFRDSKNGLLPPVMSGKVSSIPTMRFGTLEVRAKIPKGDWLWPAIWMMPKTNKYGYWPRSGEIDIMESRGNEGDIGIKSIGSTLHWGPVFYEDEWSFTHAEINSSDWHKDFHTWRLEWTSDSIATFVDDQVILSVDAGDGFWHKGGFSGDNIYATGTKMAPFDQDFFLILNLAVGGTNGYFPDDWDWGVQKPWNNSSPGSADRDFWQGRGEWLPTWRGDEASLQVDYVQWSI